MVGHWVTQLASAVHMQFNQGFSNGVEYSGTGQLHLRVSICTELRQLVSSEGRSYIQCATRFLAFFALNPTPLGVAHFTIYKTDYKEYKGPDPADKVCAADQ